MLKIAFFISGNGSNMQSILDSKLNIDPQVVITNNPKSLGVNIAKKHNIPCYVINQNVINLDKYLGDTVEEQLTYRLKEVLRRYHIDLIVLAGYLKKIPKCVVDIYPGRILNIHPSLLPKYGGIGMYGNNVHNAVLSSNDTITGCTVHVVDNGIDTGTIVKQKIIDIHPTDTTKSLSQKVLALEHEMYPQVINDITEGFLTLPFKQK